MLEDLAGRLGQHGAMHWLGYFLHGEGARRRWPLLVLLVHANCGITEGVPTEPSQVFGAALFSEYVVWGLKTGAVATEDTSGYRTVLAPVSFRAEVALRCAEILLQRNAHLVLVTYAGPPPSQTVGPLNPSSRVAVRSRSVASYLELQPTLAATLAGFDRTVRFRLGYYRRRLLQTTPCRFVADATTEIDRDKLLQLNMGSLNPVSDEEAMQRWHACSLPGGYVVGLRTEDGRWLSLIGGWRQAGTTVLYWQLNTAGWEKHSLSVLMRSYFLEHETQQQTRRIVFYGGTPHSLRHFFTPVAVTDLLLRRTSLPAWILVQMGRLFAWTAAHSRRPNFLAEMLADKSLHRQT